MRRPRGLNSAGLRLAVLYAGLFGLSALALVLFIWWATAGLLERQVEATIHADAQGLLDRIGEGGLPALIEAIQDHMSEDVDDETLYLLVDADGHHLAGNVERWPATVARPGTWYELPVQRAGTRALAEVEGIDLPGHFRLLVGRDVRTRAQLRHLLAGALLYALLLVAALGAAGALVVRSLFRRMLANVSSIAEAIAAGDLAQRVRLSGRGDEFDRLAETINDMLDRIARLMDGVRQVSNAIAHDLRTPITRARSRLEDAALHAGSGRELRAAVERAVADLDGVTAVFQALLRIAEIEAGSRRSAFGAFDCVPVLRDLAELYAALAEERGLQLLLDLPPALWLRGDRELLQQAVANLLDNAVKFSPAHGTIRLSARPPGAAPGAVPAAPPGTVPAATPVSARPSSGVPAAAPPAADTESPTMLSIGVADEGPGIAEQDRARATERFFRAEAARHTPGSGLGLALVQAVAQLHGGSLTLEPAHPGLHAVLVLPAADPAPPGSHAPGAPTASTTRAGRPPAAAAALQARQPGRPPQPPGRHPALAGWTGLHPAPIGAQPMIAYQQGVRTVFILWLGLAGVGLHAQPPPVAVTTDTREYCEHMVAQVQAGLPLTAEMQRLLDEGRHLCDQGHVRGGIMRLRRALLLIRDRAATPQD